MTDIIAELKAVVGEANVLTGKEALDWPSIWETHRADGPKHIRSFKVLDKSPWLEPAGVFAECTAGIFDGFRLDDAGNVWSSAEDGVHCLSPEGKLLGKIRAPESISNLTFGGLKKNRLFLCGTYSTFAVFVNVRGATTPRRGSK